MIDPAAPAPGVAMHNLCSRLLLAPRRRSPLGEDSSGERGGHSRPSRQPTRRSRVQRGARREGGWGRAVSRRVYRRLSQDADTLLLKLAERHRPETATFSSGRSRAVERPANHSGLLAPALLCGWVRVGSDASAVHCTRVPRGSCGAPRRLGAGGCYARGRRVATCIAGISNNLAQWPTLKMK